MKKFIIIIATLIVLYLGVNHLVFQKGWYVDLYPGSEVSTRSVVTGKTIRLDRGTGLKPFEIRGIDMGSGIPGKWSTDFAADEDTYYRWFDLIQQAGANTVRVYTVQSDNFYNAFFRFNTDHATPLYLIHGVWVDDYIQNSHADAYDDQFFGTFRDSCRLMVDVIHGRAKITEHSKKNMGGGNYRKDISPWVIGYILGVEWEDVTVAYTNERYRDNNRYNHYDGTYLHTSADATPFESMLAQIGDEVIRYESSKYREQRILAFSNWPTTDPFDYPEPVRNHFMKCAKVDVEHILPTEKFLSGQFVSYHVYPYYPDYLNCFSDWSDLGINTSDFQNSDGVLNTYAAYLTALTKHHTMPVIISEFGVSTGRGMAHIDQNTGRNQGHMSETEQGQALIDCYHDIIDSGCAGCCVFSWQDEWFKRTWNTMHAIDLQRTAYWSDYQTNEQYFGLLTFDPGNETSICYVDGDLSEWNSTDIVADNGNGMRVSMKQDEKFLYFYIHSDGFHLETDTLYIPIDATQKSGSTYCSNYGLKFERPADFLIVLNGTENSRIQVQERSEALRSTYSQNIYGYDTYAKENIPDRNSPLFVNIDMILQVESVLLLSDPNAMGEAFETGLLTYGNGNPESPGFNSLADFICSGEDIELRIPWQLLNFADPSRMSIHDDYYENYGIQFQSAERIYVGIGSGNSDSRITMDPYKLKKWENDVTDHERLKRSYYILQKCWAGGDPS